jgi:asparagine synthase (glutamine-hydrolysing)
MCGICGMVNINGQLPPAELLQSMTRTMRHRGPDDEGYHCQPGVGLGFQRLSIIDLAGGHQPMADEGGKLQLIFNGEIYNYRLLRASLEATGRHRFRTQSDTEVLLHLYREYGEDCVQHLRGMFAFAIWDEEKQQLLMARDRFGKKPLVYAEVDGSLVFASELKALLKYPGIHKDIDYPAIDLYLSLQYIPSPWTIFRQIRKLPAAHTLIWKQGRIRIERYWEPHFLPKTTLSERDAMAAMMAKLRESVELRMIADVPLGAFLSGGKDSSMIVGLMSQISSSPVKTFSIGFEEETVSELPYARRVADHFGCDHHEFVVKTDAIELLPKLAWHYGEPYADSSAVPSYYVSLMTRQYVTVALNGDGGDESFAGYPRYQAMKFIRYWNHLPLALRKALDRSLSWIPDGPPPTSLIWRFKRLLRMGASDAELAYLNSLCFFREDQKVPLYSGLLRQTTGHARAASYLNGILERAKVLGETDRYLYTDMLTYLPEDLLVKMDIASMANGLETRSPFLDHEFVELVAGFPESWKLKGFTGKKHLLTEAAKGWIPDSILRRPKQGFALPMAQWFRGPLMKHARAMLLSDRFIDRGLFRREGLEALFSEHESGRIDRSYHLWALLMLEYWYQVYIDTSV